jgi:formylglycine-generating enzyme required for sulfatase activity
VGVYSFPHRTFQEYLAACWLTGDDFPGKVAEQSRRDPGRWREVALLAGAKAARGAKAIAWMLADHLCPHELDGREDSLEDAWGAHLAGQVLAESADLAAVAEANLPKLEKIRSWHVHLLRSNLFSAPERALAGRTLAMLGDPRFDPERWFLPKDDLLGFVEVPAGRFVMGSDLKKDSQAFSHEAPQHEVELASYRIARCPVTVAQWRAFVESESYDAEPASLQGLANEPVRYVSWHDALAYCSWLEARLKELGDSRFAGVVTLPSEAQWERAARGTDGRIYPWGDKPDPERANCNESGVGSVSAVGCFPGGASRVGCEEMSGNVWEWTRSLWGKSWSEPSFGYPYVASDGREDLEAPSETLRVFRGGAFNNYPGDVRCAYRLRYDPAIRGWGLGFRVALFPFSSGL